MNTAKISLFAITPVMPPSTQTFQQERYRIVHQFGQDATSTLYKAYDNTLKVNVVLKELKKPLKPAGAAQNKAHTDFASKAKSLIKIKHDYLLSIYDYFSEAGNHYLVMESADGNNLLEAIEKEGKPFSPSKVGEWADQLLDALNYLHKQSTPIIHQRIAPQNIILTADGKVKLLFSGSGEKLGATSDDRLSNFLNSDFETASFNYLPLEQIWDGLDPASQKVILNSYDERAVRMLESPADVRSDLYSLAASLYFALTAQSPTDALARSIDLLDGKTDPLVAPNKINSSIPPEVADVLMRSLEIRRENRYDATAFMRQILRAAFGKIIPAASKTTTPPETSRIQPAPRTVKSEKKPMEKEVSEKENNVPKSSELAAFAKPEMAAELPAINPQKQNSEEINHQKKPAETGQRVTQKVSPNPVIENTSEERAGRRFIRGSAEK